MGIWQGDLKMHMAYLTWGLLSDAWGVTYMCL